MKIAAFLRTVYQRVEYDYIFTRASSLTYQSFLAIVPLLAVMFGISKGFGVDSALERFLRQELKEHTEILEYLLAFSNTALQEVQGGLIAGAGIIVLFFTAIRLFSSVEKTFNAMWGITVPRRYIHRLMSYLALIAICPLLLVIASSVTIFITTELSSLLEQSQYKNLEELVSFAISLIPLATLITLFSTLLYVIPSAYVSLRSACISGIVAAVLFQTVQMWYIKFQLSLTQFSAIYGSFVALPLFLIWLWISWFILLFAGELSIAVEERLWRYPIKDIHILPKAAQLAILNLIVQKYKHGHAASIHLLRKELNLPLKILYRTLEVLKGRNLIHEAVYTDQCIPAFVPSVSCFSYSFSDLLFDVQIHSSTLPKLTPPESAAPLIQEAYDKLNDIVHLIDHQPHPLVIEMGNRPTIADVFK